MLNLFECIANTATFVNRLNNLISTFLLLHFYIVNVVNVFTKSAVQNLL